MAKISPAVRLPVAETSKSAKLQVFIISTTTTIIIVVIIITFILTIIDVSIIVCAIECETAAESRELMA